MKKYMSIYQFIKLSAITIIMLSILTGCSQGPDLENGYEYLEDEEYEKAISIFEKASKKESDKYKAEIGLAKAYMCLEEYKKAGKSMRNAIDIDASDKETWQLLIKIYKEMEKDDDEIIALYNEAFENTENFQFESGLEDYLKKVNEKKYRQILKQIELLDQEDSLLVVSEQDIQTILYQQTYDFSQNKSINIDLNNDGVEEIVEVGMDSPNGMKVQVVQDHHGYNLLNDTTESSFSMFGDYGDLLENYFIQVVFVDFNNDGRQEIIIAIGDKTTQLAVSIFECKLSDDYISPYIEIGYFEAEDKIVIDKNQTINVPMHKNKIITEYSYNSTIDLITTLGNKGSFIFIDELMDYYDPNSSKNTCKRGKYIYLENEEQMLNFLYSNTWVYEEDNYIVLDIQENQMQSGNTGSWDVFSYEIDEINLEDKYIMIHVVLIESFSDENNADDNVREADADVKLILTNGALQMIYNYNDKDDQYISHWYIKN